MPFSSWKIGLARVANPKGMVPASPASRRATYAMGGRSFANLFFSRAHGPTRSNWKRISQRRFVTPPVPSPELSQQVLDVWFQSHVICVIGIMNSYNQLRARQTRLSFLAFSSCRQPKNTTLQIKVRRRLGIISPHILS